MIRIVDTDSHLRPMIERMMYHTPVGGWIEVRVYQFWDLGLAPSVLYRSASDRFWWAYRMLTHTANSGIELQLSWYSHTRYRFGYQAWTYDKLFGNPYRSLYRYDRSEQVNWRWLCRALREQSEKPPMVQLILYGHPQNEVFRNIKSLLHDFEPDLHSLWKKQLVSWIQRKGISSDT